MICQWYFTNIDEFQAAEIVQESKMMSAKRWGCWRCEGRKKAAVATAYLIFFGPFFLDLLCEKTCFLVEFEGLLKRTNNHSSVKVEEHPSIHESIYFFTRSSPHLLETPSNIERQKRRCQSHFKGFALLHTHHILRRSRKLRRDWINSYFSGTSDWGHLYKSPIMSAKR